MNFNINLKSAFKFTGVLFTLTAFYCLSHSILDNFSAITEILKTKNIAIVLTIGLISYGLTQVNLVIAWSFLLKRKYPNIKFKTFYKIIGISQIGKYLPGNIGHIIGRVYLAKNHSIKISDASKGILFETILVIFAGLLVGFGYFYYYKENILGLDIILFKLITLSIFIGIIAYLIYSKNNLTFKIIASVLILYITSFSILGIIIYLTQSLITNEHIPLIKYIIVITISFIAGFIMPGSPAGIGIREYVFISLVSSEIETSIALSLIFVLRIITTVGDSLMYLTSLKIDID